MTTLYPQADAGKIGEILIVEILSSAGVPEGKVAAHPCARADITAR
ncbi:hypothetical protein J8I26_14075 [Herbaspirillum sp. LeCh32-8]|nr:hypothetical protein [Herbaspirillum sp. LeCh32-8]